MSFIPLGQVGQTLSSSSFVRADSIQGGTITAQELILAGGTHGVLRSQNYNATSETGWAIFGDGSASFYGLLTIGDNAVITGDLYSSNWNGTIPANLATEDAGASAGYYLDSSVGSMQLEGDFFLGGDLDVDGTITINSGSGDRLTVAGESLFTGDMELDGAIDIDGDILLSGDILFERGTSALIETNDAPVNGDTWLRIWQVSNTGRIQGIKKSGGSETVSAELQVTNDGFGIAQGVLDLAGSGGIDSSLGADIDIAIAGTTILTIDGTNGVYLGSSGTRVDNNGALLSVNEVQVQDGSITDPSYTFTSDSNSGFYRVGENDIGVTLGSKQHILFSDGDPTLTVTPDHADGNVVLKLAIERPWEFRQLSTGASTGLEFMSTSNKAVYIGGDTLGHVLGINASDGHIYIQEGFDSIGNHETLRADRFVSGTLSKVGYYSSWAYQKKHIKPVNDRRRWKREWFLELEPVAYERRRGHHSDKDKDGYRPIELGFTIENLIENTNLLTTRGNRVGDSPDEFAILAVTVDYVQHLEKRIAELETKVAALT